MIITETSYKEIWHYQRSNSQALNFQPMQCHWVISYKKGYKWILINARNYLQTHPKVTYHQSYICTMTLDDGMAFNAIFNIISVIWQWPVHLSMHSWIFLFQVLHTIFFQSHWLPSHRTILKSWSVIRKEWIHLQWLLSILQEILA